MMSTTFETQKLHESFTFRIVEAVKRTKIQPMPKATGLPWGLSLAASIIFTVMSLSPHLNSLNPMSPPMGSPLPSKTKVLKTGEIPVEILEVDQILALASKKGEGDGGKPERPDPKNADLMIACGGGDSWRKRASMPTGRTGLSAGVVNGMIYAIGGMATTVFSTVEEYDPLTNTWTAKASMLTSRGTCTSRH